MPKTVTVTVLISIVAMLASVGFASSTSLTAGPGSSPVVRLTPQPNPAYAVPRSAPGNAGPTIHWDKFYDRQGNPLPSGPPDSVSADSLYFKKYIVLDTVYGCPKSQIPNPTPAPCRSAFTWQLGQDVVGMDPAGTYIYEVNNTTLRRHNTNDGTHTDYTISRGYQTCGTDGKYVYALVGDTVYKYTLTGSLVNSTTLDITPGWYGLSVANDTVWCGGGSGTITLHGYACSKFNGGLITTDVAWNIGSGGTANPGPVTWDGRYYYVTWLGLASDTFRRFNADRTLSASGTINMDTRGLMCSVHYPRQVTQDSLYWKLYTSTSNLYSSPKAQNVTPAQPTLIAWQSDQSVPCMTPDGHYVFEVSGTNLRRTDQMTGAEDNYALANAGAGPCGTDGEYVYVPNGTTTRKYTLNGTLVNSTTTDYGQYSEYGFGVANDTVWISPADNGATWYGYACSKFTGGSLTHDATWTTDGGALTAMTVAFDGQYYYMVWGGHSTDTLLRFYRDRTLYSSGTVTGDARSVMCKELCPLMIVTTDEESLRAELAETLQVASGGIINAIGTYSIETNAAFPATEWYNAGCKVILEFSGGPYPSDINQLGDSLAKFVDLGGRVVTTMWADNTNNLGGRYVTQYMPFTMQNQHAPGDSLGLVHDPLHPVMNGVTAIKDSLFITGNTISTLRSPNCVCLAEWSTAHRVVAAYLDSSGVRLVSLGFVPFKYYSGIKGDWAKLMVNALLWVGPWVPAVSVTAPATGNVWYVGTSQNIIWTAGNGPITRDSIVYSYDNGATWNFLNKYTGSRTSYTWNPIPNTPDTNCYVRVFSWNAAGQAFANSGRFTIGVPVHDVGVTQIIQPVDTVDSGATVVPTAVVKNFGGVQETFPVRFNIGAVYTHDTTVTIASGATDTVALLQWIAGPVGTYVVRCSTRLDADTNHANDRAMDTVVVRPMGGIAQTGNNALPRVFALHQPSPNPSATGAQIRYDLPRPAQVELRIYDVSGTLVRRLVGEAQTAGYRDAYWNGCDNSGRTVASGVYYCRFKADDFVAAQKLIVRR